MASPALTFEELDDWLWCLRTPAVACYAVRDRDGFVLVDANVAGQHRAILDALADRLGVSNRAVPVRQVLLTHAHPDHYGSARQVALRTGSELLGPAQEADVFAGRTQLAAPRLQDWERPFFEQAVAHVRSPEPVELDRLLLPGDVLGWEIGAELIDAPGHTPGQLAVWIPEHRTLLAADALATHAGQPIVGVFNIDPEQATRSALRLLELEPTRLCVGHGTPLIGDVRGMFAQARQDWTASGPSRTGCAAAVAQLSRDVARHDRERGTPSGRL